MEGQPDISKWNTIYPAYISKNKTKPLGRRIPLEKAVEYPHVMEVAQVCKDLRLKFAVEVRPAPCQRRPSAAEPPPVEPRVLILDCPPRAGQGLLKGCINARAS